MGEAKGRGIWARQASPLHAPYRALFLDRHADGAAPLGPGAVVVADLRVAEQLFQDEPGVGGPLTDAAVGDHLAVGLHALPTVDAPQLVRALEGPILLDGCRPGHVDGGRDVAAPRPPT